MAKGKSLPKASNALHGSSADLSKTEIKPSSLEVKLEEKAKKEVQEISLDISSLPPLGSKRDDILSRVNAIEAKLNALVSLLSK